MLADGQPPIELSLVDGGEKAAAAIILAGLFLLVLIFWNLWEDEQRRKGKR